MPHDFYLFLYPETAYAFEQSRLYPTKRALMLVSRAWAELAVEFMYESLVIDYFGVGRPRQVLAALEGSAGLVLKKWVKRVDRFRCPLPPQKDYVCERLARIGLPNLRVQNMVSNRDAEKAPLENLLSEQPLHLMEACGSPILERLTSGTFRSLRCLTLWMIKPLVTPLHLPSNLRRLTIILYDTTYLRVQNIFSTRDSFTLPNLTHLALHHRNESPDRFVRSMEIINHIGPQLRHLTLTAIIGTDNWNGDDLCTTLRVCTQLRELVIPLPLASWKAEHGDYGHPILQTLGIPITWKEDFESCIGIFSRRGAFPRLGVIRFVSQHIWGHRTQLMDRTIRPTSHGSWNTA